MGFASTANVRQIGYLEVRTVSAPSYAAVGRPSTMARAATMVITTAAVLLLALTSPAHAAVDVTLLHTFTGGNDGAFLNSTLTADSAGNFYGTAQIGGAFGAGTVFELSPKPEGKWRFSLLYTFTGGTDGGNPLGTLVFDRAGNAYAT